MGSLDMSQQHRRLATLRRAPLQPPPSVCDSGWLCRTVHSHTILPIRRIVSISDYGSLRAVEAERYGSGAAESGSDEGTDAVSRRLSRLLEAKLPQLICASENAICASPLQLGQITEAPQYTDRPQAVGLGRQNIHGTIANHDRRMINGG